jgi:hypothetical protein
MFTVEQIEPSKGHPTLMTLSGAPGVGKSSLTAGLNVNGYKNLVVDFQSGYTHIGGHVLDLRKEAAKAGKSMSATFLNKMHELRQSNIENKDFLFDFITFDPLAAFKPLVIERAAALYNNSLLGKSAAEKKAISQWGPGKFTPQQLASCYSKDPVTDLGQNGWNWYNQAWNELFLATLGLARYCTLFIAHTKFSSLKKSSIEEISVREIDFWPSYLLHLIGESSDSGAVYRKENEVIASFVLKQDQDHFKSRHFDGKEIVLSTKSEDGTITTHWESIFPFIAQPKV